MLGGTKCIEEPCRYILEGGRDTNILKPTGQCMSSESPLFTAVPP